MTRETKIGLLVSLAFVIAVGVLLSDHMVNSTDPKPAPVVAAGGDIAKGLALPDRPNPGLNTPVQPDANVTPPQRVPSVTEVAAPLADPGKNTIEIRPPSGKPIEIANTNGNLPQVPTEIHITPPTEPVAGANPGVHQTTLAPGNTAAGPLAPETAATSPADSKYQSYVAVAGDNVAKMARKFLGADTKANRDLIIAANDNLKKDPTKVVVGKTYCIPVKAAPAAALADASTPRTAIPLAATEPAKTTQQATPAPAPARTYVVKSGDNLWKIAKGDARLMEEIRKLNRDALKGQNLKIGMTLRMPAKRVG